MNNEKEFDGSHAMETSVFHSDPKRFMELVSTDDAEERFNGFLDKDGYSNFDDLVLCEVVRYGVNNDQTMISDLSQFYREMAMKLAEDRRATICRHVAWLVENTSIVSINAFLPFIAEDSDRGIVSTAVIHFVSLGPLTDDDPMSRPKDIIGMIESAFLENEGAAFGALLNLGDERVCKLLLPIRDSLEPDAVNEAIKCATGFISSATANFYLDWLEGMEGSDADGLFGIVASGLALLKRSSQLDQVITGQRPFPAKSVNLEEWNAMAKPIPLEMYLHQLAPRAIALERSEPPPRVMPHILKEWGLEPTTDPSEAATFDDRHRPPQ